MMAIQVQGTNKRTFYKVLQVSDDADMDAIEAAYHRLKSKYRDQNDSAARNELLFIEHAYQTLSDCYSRSAYDRQIAVAAPPIPHDVYHGHSEDGWFTSSKLLVVMIGLLAIVAYGIKTGHTKEIGDSVQRSRASGQSQADPQQVEREDRCRDGHLLVAQAGIAGTNAEGPQARSCN